jgi:hypothetical protein
MGDIHGGSIRGHAPGSITGGSIDFGVGHHHAPTTPVAVRTYAQTVGDGATTVFAITHNLNTLDTQESAYNPLTGAVIDPTTYTVVHTSPTVATFTFAAAPAAGAARVVIQA